MSTQLCNTIADDLTRTADNVVQLYKRLTIDKEDEGACIDRDTMLRGLQSSVNETMRTLRLVIAGGESLNAGSSATGDNVAVSEATATFQELLAGQDQGKVVNMMQQYSELAVDHDAAEDGGYAVEPHVKSVHLCEPWEMKGTGTSRRKLRASYLPAPLVDGT